jgi:eukaryotic-like serine/threonine-protein kinase
VVEPTRTCLGNRYELRGLLATGGMGQVWRAHDQLLGRPVAVKVLRSEYTGDPLFRARFRAEAQHAAALSHPNIAAVYDFGEEQTTDGSGEHLSYLVMELVEGESLSALITRTGPLTPDQTLLVLRQTAAALAVAHAAGVVHRDVKPGNVLVREDGTVKITDFGIAWSAGSVPLTQTGQVVGTAAYLSPEQAAGSHATPASDVYSLGMVGYECLTGHKAFDGDNSVAIALRQLRDQPAPLPDEVPAGVRTLVEHALVKDPGHRWPDGAAFVAAIDDVRAGRELPPVQHSDTLGFWLVPGGPLDTVTSTGTAPGTGSGAGAAAGVPGGAAVSTAAGRPRTVVTPPAVPVRARVGRVLLPVATLLVGAGVAAAVLQQSDSGSSEVPVAAAQVAGPATGSAAVLVDDQDYLGRPVDEVTADLTARGLLVDTQPVATADVEPGLVIAVSPSGRRLERGDEVLVRYAIALRDDSPAPTTARRAPVESVLQPPARTAPRTTAATPTPTVATVASPTDSTTEPTQITQITETTESTSGSATPTSTSASSSSRGRGSGGGSTPSASPTGTAGPSSGSPGHRPGD